VPLLVIHDDGDRMVPYAEAGRIMSANPHARLLTTTGLGHSRLLAGDAVLDAVLEHLDASSRRETAQASDAEVDRLTRVPVAA
jgi:pimeloyl-ACP methyl ester carboxylesterase